MAVTSKTLTFVPAPEFRGSCKLTLAFVPSGGVAFKEVHPVAWRVFELNEGGSQTVVWTDNIAGCRATVDNTNSKVTTEPGYQAVAPGYATDLLLDSTQKNNPQYSFTKPTPFGGPGNYKSRVGNMSGVNIDHFGTGFIVKKNNKETMDTVLVTNSVKDGGSVFINYVPLLKMWANQSVEQSQLLPKSWGQKATAWEADVSELTNREITIEISRGGDGKIKGTVVSGVAAIAEHSSLAKVQDRHLEAGANPQVTYTARIAFKNPNIVSQGMIAIAKHLPANVYSHIKIVVKGSDITGRLTFTLPACGSCNEAEKDVVAAIKDSASSHGKAYVTSHGGAMYVSSEDGCEQWTEIYPSRSEWYGNVTTTEGAAFDATADAQAFAAEHAADAAGDDKDDKDNEDDEATEDDEGTDDDEAADGTA